MATVSGGRAISGARAILKVDSQIVGWATGIQGSETVEVVPIAILGELDIQTHEIVGRTCSITASTVRIMGSPMSAIQGTTGTGIATGSTNEILSDPAAFTYKIEVFDEVGDGAVGKPIYKFENCMMTSRAFTVDRGGVMAVNVTFVSTKMTDELTT
jgi:hypothetical protein